MQLRILLFLILICNFHFAFSQDLNAQKSALEKVFTKSIHQPRKSKISIGENSWKLCIETTSNEIFLYETKFEKFSDCCQYINWTFYKKNKFIKNISNLCSEPPLSTVTTGDDWYTIGYTIESNNLILNIISKNNTEKFVVEEILKRTDGLHIIRLLKL
ncbi:hypothetical protein PQ459_06450 [Chryseobacterium sp. KACC 21268]|nr:hypothetical protein PQ459_06450 [Chryseobacterium sp. KACC 21268]